MPSFLRSEYLLNVQSQLSKLDVKFPLAAYTTRVQWQVLVHNLPILSPTSSFHNLINPLCLLTFNDRPTPMGGSNLLQMVGILLALGIHDKIGCFLKISLTSLPPFYCASPKSLPDLSFKKAAGRIMPGAVHFSCFYSSCCGSHF